MTLRSSFLSLFLPLVMFAQESGVSWKTADEILARIRKPVFADRAFVITAYGAATDGVTDCTDAIARAIAECSASGGGRVVVPAGTFVTGAIHLKSNVNLVVSKGATLKFSTDPKKYLPMVLTRWEGVELMNYSALIYAYGQENIAVTGEGTLDGQGAETNWWSWKGNKKDAPAGTPNQKAARTKLMEMSERGVPVAERIFGDGSYLRPNFVQPYNCRNVLISGVTIKDSPMWFLHPVLCTNVTVEKVTVVGLGPNNDGCDPESCTDVLIDDCTFQTGDDCIAIKSGRNADGRRLNRPTENVIIRNSTMADGHGGVVIGSEISGSVRNVFVQDCAMDSPNLDRALRFKTNSVRGGIIENIFARRITVGRVAEAVVLVDFNYEEGDAGAFTPILRNVNISDVSAQSGTYAIYARGYERSPVTGLRLENCRFDNMKKPNVLEHVKDLTVRNVSINGALMKEQ